MTEAPAPEDTFIRDTTPWRLSAEEATTLEQAVAPLVPVETLASTIEDFRTYLAELSAWNVRGNLVAASDRPRLVRRHVVESLAAAPLLDRLGGERLIDAGTGGGFPGIPIKLVRPGLEVILVESRRLKSLFLSRVVGMLGRSGLHVWKTRVESLAELPAALPGLPGTPGNERSFPRSSDTEGPAVRPQTELLTARALAPIAVVTAWCAPLVRPGGHLVTFKGSRLAAEIEAWEKRPGPWAVAEVITDAAPGLTLVAIRRLPEER